MRTLSSFITRPACFALTLLLAGACAAMPAQAFAAASASASADTKAAASAASDADVQTISIDGLAMDVPSDWLSMDLGSSMLCAYSPEADMAVTAAVVSDDSLVLSTDEQELASELAALGAASVPDEEGVLLADGMATLTDGTTPVYAAVYDLTATETPVYYYIACIAMDQNTVGAVVITIDPSAADSDIPDEISNSLRLVDASDAAASASASAAAVLTDGQQVTTAGISITLPADVTNDATSTESSDWYTADENFGVSIAPNLIEASEAAYVTSENVDILAQYTIAAMGGELLGSTTIDNGASTLLLYAFTASDDEGTYFGGLGFVQVADGSLTGITTLCTMDEAETYGDIMDAIFASVQVNE